MNDADLFPYQYQLIYYIPDLLHGEFVVMGFLLWSNQERDFRYYVTPDLSRAINFFAGAPDYFGRTLSAGLKTFQEACAEVELSAFKDLSAIGFEILPPNSNALQLSEIKSAITDDLEKAYRQFVGRVERYSKKSSNLSESN